jgi:hypothetical protein
MEATQTVSPQFLFGLSNPETHELSAFAGAHSTSVRRSLAASGDQLTLRSIRAEGLARTDERLTWGQRDGVDRSVGFDGEVYLSL